MRTEAAEVVVGPVAESDAGEITLLLNRIISAGTYTAMTEIMSVADQQHFIRSLPPRAVYLAARDRKSHKLLGVQDCLPGADAEDLCDISTFVSLDAARSGIGRALFAETRAYAQKLGYRSIRAVIRSDNEGAQNYYRRMGFDIAWSAEDKTVAFFTVSD